MASFRTFEPVDDLLVYLFEKPLAGIEHLVVDLGLQLVLQLVECSVDFRFTARALDDLEDAALNIHAALDHAQYFVACSEDALEQVELEVEKLVDTLFGVVLEVKKVDDGHVDLLAVAVAAADTLFDALRVPGQVEIDKQGTELKVDTFGSGLGGDQDALAIAERLDDGGLHVRSL